MSNPNFDPSPDMMAMLDSEQKAIKSKRRGFRQVKIEENDSWLLRYLPYTFGQTNKFYLKVANHWIFRKPYFCPRETDPEAGGDPNYNCELCATCDDMRNSNSRAVKNAGFKGSATQQWLMYCFVYEREIAKNHGAAEVIEDPEELWTPWEYWHSQWGFDEFISIFRKNYNDRRHPTNVLDFMTGSNFWARGTTKGVSLQKHDSGPISDGTPEQVQEIINFAWSKIKVPTLTELTDEQVEAALVKLEELTREQPQAGGGSRDNRPRGRSFRESGDDGDLGPQPAPRVGTSAPAAQPPSARQPAPPTGAPPPPRVSPPANPVPRVGASAPPAVTAKPPSVTQSAPTLPSTPAAPKTVSPTLSDRLRTRAPISPAANGNPNAQSTIDDDDNVTNEQRDPAPPAEVPVDDTPPPVSAEGDAGTTPAPQVTPTAPPAASGPAVPKVGRPGLTDKLRGAIVNASNRR